MAIVPNFSDSVLKLIFNAEPIDKIADNATTAPLTQLYLSLHTADPGNSGDQSVSEVVYTGYARMPVTRDETGWTVLAGNVYLTGVVEFPNPVAVATAQVATFFGIGEALAGAGELYYKGALAPPITILLNQPPRIDNMPVPSHMTPGWD